MVFSAVGDEAVPSRRENDAIVDRLLLGANPLAAEERVTERITSRVAVADPKFIVLLVLL